MYDILCYGALCADQCIHVPRLPALGEGVQALGEEQRAGGNALNEAVALAQWGHRVVLMGDPIGNDSAGTLLRTAIAATTIDSAYLHYDAKVLTPRCTILVTPDGQRTIVALRHKPTTFHPPPDALLANSRLISITRYGPHTAEVAHLARTANRPILIGDATRPDDAWSAYADVIVTSVELIQTHNPGLAVARQLAALHALRGATILLTNGPHPVEALWRDEQGEVRSLTHTPPSAPPTDTTGAGDRFRAGVAHGMLAGWSWPRIIAFACTEATALVTSRVQER